MFTGGRVIGTKLPALGLLTTAACAIVLACAPGVSSAAQAGSGNSGKALTPVSIVNLRVADNVVVWLGVENGYFAKHGLKVTYKNISGGGPAIVKAVQSGSVEFGQLSSTVFLTATSHGVPVIGVSAVSRFPSSTSPEGLFVKASSTIKSIAQLKGANVGVNALTSMEETRLVTQVLPSAHLGQSDVHLVPVPFPQMQQALATGLVTAVVPFDPFTTKMRQSSDFRQLTNLSEFVPHGGLALGVIIARTDYASAHPKIVKEFQAGLAESIAEVIAHPASAAALVAKVMRLPMSIAKPALSDIGFVPEGKPNIAAYDNMAALLRKVNRISAGYNVTDHFVH